MRSKDGKFAGSIGKGKHGPVSMPSPPPRPTTSASSDTPPHLTSQKRLNELSDAAVEYLSEHEDLAHKSISEYLASKPLSTTEELQYCLHSFYRLAEESSKASVELEKRNYHHQAHALRTIDIAFRDVSTAHGNLLSHLTSSTSPTEASTGYSQEDLDSLLPNYATLRDTIHTSTLDAVEKDLAPDGSPSDPEALAVMEALVELPAVYPTTDRLPYSI